VLAGYNFFPSLSATGALFRSQNKCIQIRAGKKLLFKRVKFVVPLASFRHQESLPLLRKVCAKLLQLFQKANVQSESFLKCQETTTTEILAGLTRYWSRVDISTIIIAKPRKVAAQYAKLYLELAFDHSRHTLVLKELAENSPVT
jgi:hypothetical protein